jgi:hypothetical protein
VDWVPHISSIKNITIFFLKKSHLLPPHPTTTAPTPTSMAGALQALVGAAAPAPCARRPYPRTSPPWWSSPAPGLDRAAASGRSLPRPACLEPPLPPRVQPLLPAPAPAPAHGLGGAAAPALAGARRWPWWGSPARTGAHLSGAHPCGAMADKWASAMAQNLPEWMKMGRPVTAAAPWPSACPEWMKMG